ncbi:MAG: DUF971 domain-containing protein [Deltaproteobacteria bacterium]|nr:DUF971 domain-containing protein [Deltaproteobacteria bacterium]
MALKLSPRKPRDIIYADDLKIEWGDGVVAHYPFFYLRDLCPCAACVDEISGEKILDSSTIPGDIHVTGAEYVGNYALRVNWSDGHDTGIYTFASLREMYDHSQETGGEPGGPFTLES